jgi:signal recognition particle receptor subunit beta
VVDSADKDRVGISKDELLYMLREEELSTAVLLVLANKQDIEGCLSVAEVHQALGLDALKNRTFQVSLKKLKIDSSNDMHLLSFRFSKHQQRRAKD